MLGDLPPETNLLESSAPTKLAGRTRLHEHVVVVEVARVPLLVGGACGFLLVDVRHVLLTERAVVKPVVAHPAVHHGIHRHRDLERRMRIDQCREGEVSVV